MSNIRTQISLSVTIKNKCDQYYEITGFGISTIVTMALMEFFEKRSTNKPASSSTTDPEEKLTIPLMCWNDDCKNKGNTFQGRREDGCPSCGESILANA